MFDQGRTLWELRRHDFREQAVDGQNRVESWNSADENAPITIEILSLRSVAVE